MRVCVCACVYVCMYLSIYVRVYGSYNRDVAFSAPILSNDLVQKVSAVTLYAPASLGAPDCPIRTPGLNPILKYGVTEEEQCCVLRVYIIVYAFKAQGLGSLIPLASITGVRARRVSGKKGTAIYAGSYGYCVLL